MSEPKNNKKTDLNRRRFLYFTGGMIASGASLTLSSQLAAAGKNTNTELANAEPVTGFIKRRIETLDNVANRTAATVKHERVLKFFNTHTHEELSVAYWSDGKYSKDGLAKLDLLLRDHRANEAVIMDPKLFDQLWAVQQRLQSTDTFEIISGYRSPATNAMLRKRSSGVASRSYHLQGRAIDIRLRGSKTSDLRQAALEMKAGGVGYYPGSDFIHIDTGPVRSWS